MKTKCIIIDDEPIAIRVIKNHLQHFEEIEVVAECKSAMQAFEVLSKTKVDLMFLDIQMPKITGMDFLKTITNPPKAIVVTAYRDYAVESFEMDVIDYLLKPVSLERLMKAINKYKQSISANDIEIMANPQIKEDEFIYVKENKRILKIYLKDIVFLESMREYVKIHTETKTIIIKNAISNFEDKLPAELFIRVHKSFIVSVAKITSFGASMIELSGVEIPISRTYKQSVLNHLNYNKEI